MDKIRAITKLNEEELKLGILNKGSWHERYKHSAYIFVGGLPYEMNEGDIAVVFSQFGEIVDIHLSRDPETGKSKGFAFLSYTDQRSTILAVDNFNGIELGPRHILVDHVDKYRVPKEYIKPADPAEEPPIYMPSGPDGKGFGDLKRLNEADLQALHPPVKSDTLYDEDERWERELMSSVHHKKPKHHHHDRHR